MSQAMQDFASNILWMYEILHQLVDGLSHCNPIIYSVFIVPNSCQLVQDFFHPQYEITQLCME